MRKIMKKRALTLLLIFILPIALNTLLVQALDPGTGKFLTIAIDPENCGYVTATKVKSGETWTFTYAVPPQTEKVGAGTIELMAIANPGWVFSHWEGDLEGLENPTEYKTQKYGYVKAVFDVGYIITASVVGDGAILVDGDVLADPNDPSGDVTVESGATPTFEFTPYAGSRITSVVVIDDEGNSDYKDIEESYTFPPVTADQTIVVVFDEEGTATVLPGEGQKVSPYEGLIVDFFTTDGGVVEGGYADYTVGAAAAIHVISVEFPYEGGMLLTLEYDDTDLSLEDELNLRVIHGLTLEAVRCDVNGDATVDGTDVSIVANAVKKYPDWYTPACDINDDGLVTEDDLLVVNQNKGAWLEDITVEGSVDTDNNTIQAFVTSNAFFCIR